MNVVVVVMDSLRADHVYGPRARTPTMNKVGQEGVRFTRAYPEAMPTIPARRAIMAGRRTYPVPRLAARTSDLPPQPGWEPVGSDGKMWTEVLREQGWTTGYVTDNPHMLLRRAQALPPDASTASSWWTARSPLRFKPKRKVTQAEVARHLPPSLRGSRAEPRMAAYLAGQPARPRRGGLPGGARVPRRHELDRVGEHAPAVRARDRLLRRARAVGRAAPHQGHVRAADTRRLEPIQPFPTPAAKYARARAVAARS